MGGGGLGPGRGGRKEGSQRVVPQQNIATSL